MKRPATNDHPVHELIRERWSPRTFGPQPVSDDELASLLEAARWAPSSRNEQPWRFIVTTRAVPEEHQNVFDTLDAGNQKWAGQAPVLMIVAAKRSFTRDGKPNAHAFYDTGAAIAFLSLQATACGLVLHQLAGFDRDRAAALLGIPEQFEPVVAIALGHPADAGAVTPEMAERERAPRTRKPQSEWVFRGRWGASPG